MDKEQVKCSKCNYWKHIKEFPIGRNICNVCTLQIKSLIIKTLGNKNIKTFVNK